MISPEQFLSHWQAHRRLTRRTIEAFPEDQLFTFSIGGMRPFGVLVMELIGTGVPFVEGALTGSWNPGKDYDARPKAELLRLWDEDTERIDALWPQISTERFGEAVTAFEQWPGSVTDFFLYALDNEIHHRGQGYVYLRALGIDPPPFYDRS